jgi:hypothetical protein
MTMCTYTYFICPNGHRGHELLSENDQPYSKMWERTTTEGIVGRQGVDGTSFYVFLWSPRLYRPLLAAFKQPLLDTASHYDQLGDHAKQYADFLTFAALEPADTFTSSELAKATAKLPQDGLQHAAQALARALGGAGEQRVEYWRNRLVPVEYPDYLTHLLHESNLCQRFPSDVLDFMDRVIGAAAQWTPTELGQCLQQVLSASPPLASDPRFVRLSTYYRANGGT